MPQVLRAEHLGFCFGVRDALAVADKIADPHATTVFGELVHNESVTRGLHGRGFDIVAETDREQLPSRRQVMITAHGISEQRRERLESAGHQLIDTTCPLVRRVHDAATRLAARGYFVVVIGKPNHVEVQGIVEDLPHGGYTVIDRDDAADRYDTDRIGIICQTTMPEDLAKRCRDRVTMMNPHASVRWIDTVCRPTKQRQNAVDQLCEKVQVVVVVGGENSNNTRRLAQRCRTHGVTAFHVQSADELPIAKLRTFDRIGLTAGTSTPDETIDAVEARLLRIDRFHSRSRGVPPRGASAAYWTEYFRRNLADQPEIPWSPATSLSPEERRSVLRSIQTFQLGESGEGKHILRCAARWVRQGGDADYLEALKLFIAEENQHARWLGRFLLQEQSTLLSKQWTDSCFRFLRHLAGLRTSISVLVTAEILAQVYYLALSRATESAALQAICRRVLRDERYHVTFQCEQAQRLSKTWSRPRKWLTSAFENALFVVAKRIVWREHQSVFHAAGFSKRDFFKRADRRWRAARRKPKRVDPTCVASG